MKVLYYEVSDYMVDRLGGKYFRCAIPGSKIPNQRVPQIIGNSSNRIWEWDSESDTVRYVKNRQTGIMTMVDRKEFMLIQIHAEEY